MSPLSVSNALDGQIYSIATAIPEKTVQNKPEHVKAIGIATRHVATHHTTKSLCVAAARKAMEGTNPADYAVVILVTQTPEHVTPATACLIQHELGLPKSCMAFDVNLGCSGYTYGLQMMMSLLRQKQTGLLLVGDTSSRICAHDNPATEPVFSDAGSATVVKKSSDGSWSYFDHGTDGSGADAIMAATGPAKNPNLEERQLGLQPSRLTDLQMKGLEVFSFATSVVPKSITNLLNYCNAIPEAVSTSVLHQANAMINKAIVKKSKLDPDNVLDCLFQYGNAAGASIPLAITAAANRPLEAPILMAGYGVGLSWCSMLYLGRPPIVHRPVVVP